MQQEQDGVEVIAKGDVHYRIAGVSLMAGAIVTAAGFLVHPFIKDITDMDEYVKAISDTRGGQWEIAQLLMVFGFLALLVGILGAHRLISARGAAWARFGVYLVAIGTAVWLVHKGVELGFPFLVEEWESATGSEKDTLFTIAASIRQVDLGLPPVFIIAFMSGMTLLGIGMVQSGVYPKWLAWSIIVIAAVSVLFGALGSAIDPALAVPSIIMLFVFMVWSLATGIWISRRAW